MGKTAGGGGRGSRRPGAVGGVAAAPRSGAARAPAAAAGPFAAPPARRPRAAGHPRPARRGARAAAWSRGAPAGGTGTSGRPLAQPAPPCPAPPLPHLPAVQRQVAEAQQGQPAHGGLRVALPGAEPLQDHLLPQEPRSRPALQQLGGGHWVSALAFCAGQSRLGAKLTVTPPHPSWKRAHPGEEGHGRQALCVVCAAQPRQQVSEQASQVVVGVGHQGTGTGPNGSFLSRSRPPNPHAPASPTPPPRTWPAAGHPPGGCGLPPVSSSLQPAPCTLPPCGLHPQTAGPSGPPRCSWGQGQWRVGSEGQEGTGQALTPWCAPPHLA